MPSIPDIPGKGLVTGTTKRARVVAGAAAAGALAGGTFVAKRVLGHVDGKGGEGAAEAKAPPTPPMAAEKPAPKPKPAKPKAAKAKPVKPKAAKAKSPKRDNLDD